MTIEIEQDKLCDFCKDWNDSSMNMCEGTDCEKMTELYMEEHGITEEQQQKIELEGITQHWPMD